MTAIVINLNQLKALMLEFLEERGITDTANELDALRRLTLSDFLLWLRQKETQPNGKKTTFSIASVKANRPVDR